LPLCDSGKTLIYIAAELAVEMFFRKMGRVAIEGDGKCIKKQLESRIFKGFDRRALVY
jgi:hypothetical protein